MRIAAIALVVLLALVGALLLWWRAASDEVERDGPQGGGPPSATSAPEGTDPGGPSVTTAGAQTAPAANAQAGATPEPRRYVKVHAPLQFASTLEPADSDGWRRVVVTIVPTADCSRLTIHMAGGMGAELSVAEDVQFVHVDAAQGKPITVPVRVRPAGPGGSVDCAVTVEVAGLALTSVHAVLLGVAPRGDVPIDPQRGEVLLQGK